MTAILELKIINEDGEQPLARLDEDVVLIGRSPEPKGIALPSMSVSSVHGVFERHDFIWFYSDIGSTNGSAFNDIQLEPNIPLVLRDGDKLVLANTIVQLGVGYDNIEQAKQRLVQPLVFLFYNNKHLTTLIFEQHNQTIVLGGQEADVEIAPEFSASNQWLFRLDGRRIVFELHAADKNVLHNGRLVAPASRLILEDRGSVYGDGLVAVYAAPLSNISSGEEVKSYASGTFIQPSANYSKKNIYSSKFGQIDDNNDSIKTDAIMRAAKERKNQSVTVDKLIYLIGFLAIIAIFLLLFWFLLF